MKVLCLTTNISTVGGIERVMSVLANRLVQEDNIEIQISSLYKYETRNPSFKIDEKVKLKYHDFEVFTPKNTKDKILQNIKQFQAVKKVLKYEDYDLIMTFHPHISVPVILYKLLLKKKCIVTEHSSYENCTKFWSLMRRLTYKYADKVVVLTESNRKKYARFSPQNLIVMPNPIPFKTLETSSLKQRRIISVGRLEAEKGFERLIDIYKIIADNCLEWSLAIIGDGSQKELLLKKICENNLEDRVHIIPFTDDMLSEYLNASICVIPSYTEAFPMVLLEAMHCGLPVVSFNFLGAKEILADSDFGLLVEQNDIEQFSTYLLSLISDYEFRLIQGSKGRKLSEKYTVDNIIKEWKLIINELR